MTTANTLDEVRLVRSREAAALLDVSRRQLDRLLASGSLRPVRLTERGHRRVRLTDLAALVAKEE